MKANAYNYNYADNTNNYNIIQKSGASNSTMNTNQKSYDHYPVSNQKNINSDYFNYMNSSIEKEALNYNITKLKAVISGGAMVQESIRNGVFSLEGIAKDDDIVIIHDGVRPMVDTEVLTDVINVCEEKGNAVTSLPYNEQIFVKKDEMTTVEYIPSSRVSALSCTSPMSAIPGMPP